MSIQVRVLPWQSAWLWPRRPPRRRTTPPPPSAQDSFENLCRGHRPGDTESRSRVVAKFTGPDQHAADHCGGQQGSCSGGTRRRSRRRCVTRRGHVPARRERQYRHRRFHLHARLRHAGFLYRWHPGPGAVTRDVFNTEQVESPRSAGPGYGRGAASGYVDRQQGAGHQRFQRRQRSCKLGPERRITGDVNHRFEARHRVPPEPHGTERRRRRPRLHQREAGPVSAVAGVRPGGDTRATSTLHRAGQRPDGGVTDARSRGQLHNAAFDRIRCRRRLPVERGCGARSRRQRKLRLRQRLRRDQGHDVHGPHRTRLQRNRLAAQHHALRQAAPVLCAEWRECADAHLDGSQRLDRGAYAPGEIPGKLAAHQPDQHRVECEHRRNRSRRHGRFRVHRRRAVQPGLRRPGHAGPRQCLQPESQ